MVFRTSSVGGYVKKHVAACTAQLVLPQPQPCSHFLAEQFLMIFFAPMNLYSEFLI